MTALLVIFGITLLLVTLFYLPFPIIGKHLYSLSIAIESKIAGLTTYTCILGDDQITYYDNRNMGKPTLLLLHCFSADRHIWLRFAKHFTQSHRLFIPDLLGHGDNTYSAQNNYSSYTQANMLVAFIKQQKLTEVVVIGSSMGGMVAAILFSQHTSLFKRCILIDPAGAKSDFALEESKKGQIPFLINDLDEFDTFYKRSMVKPPILPRSVINFLAKKNYIEKYEQLRHQFLDFFNVDEFFTDPFEIAPDRWLVIWGECDGLLPVTDADYWRMLTGSNPRVFSSIGHMSMVECPTETAQAVKQFLSQ
ncbi:MAG: alpha/beta hydrolase [Pseudomonadota bacterium]